MADLAKLTQAQLIEVAQANETHECPGCSERVSFLVTANGTQLDILHPQPPCDGFRRFHDDLMKRASAASRQPPLL
jgi:hypothetical protein